MKNTARTQIEAVGKALHEEGWVDARNVDDVVEIQQAHQFHVYLHDDPLNSFHFKFGTRTK